MPGVDEAANSFEAEMAIESGEKVTPQKRESKSEKASTIEDIFPRMKEGLAPPDPNESEAEDYEEEQTGPKNPDDDPDEDDDDEGEGEEGDEEESEEDEAEEVAEKPPIELDAIVEVTIDGQPKEVSLKEAIEGYIRTETFHQRMNAIHQEKQVIEREKGEISVARDVYQKRLTALTEQIDLMTPKEPNWDELYAGDAVTAARLERQWRTFKEQRGALEGEKQRVAQEAERENVQKMQAFVASERQRMVSENPKWTDPKVWERDRSSMMKTAKAVGFNDQELNELYDSRMVKILHKAAKYDRMMAKKPVPFKSGVKPFARPGAVASRSAPKGNQRAEKQLARTGSIHDAARVFENMLSKER